MVSHGWLRKNATLCVLISDKVVAYEPVHSCFSLGNIVLCKVARAGDFDGIRKKITVVEHW